jgi:hypothetical protein
LHADSYGWTFVALGSDGTLYANIWAGPGQGLYTIDRITGTPTLVVNGGPAAGGNGVYYNMLGGQDGKLYCVGSIDGTASGVRLFRLDGSQFTIVATLPDAGYGLAQDTQGLFYTVTGVASGGVIHHEVWVVDPTTWSASLLADGPINALCLAYDRARDRLYVTDDNGNIFFFAKSATPVLHESWGATKVRYH